MIKMFSQSDLSQYMKPVYKKDSRNKKRNYKPASIFHKLSRIYERCMCAQMNKYVDHILSKYKFEFRKRYSAYQCFLAVTEKWRASLDQTRICSGLLTDLSKAFDTAWKVSKYGAFSGPYFSEFGLNKEIYSVNLSNRPQQIKVNNLYSSWIKNLLGAWQGSILGPISF